MINNLLWFTLIIQVFNSSMTIEPPLKPVKEFWFWNQTDLPRKGRTRSEEFKKLEGFRVEQQISIDPSIGINQPVSGVYQPFEVSEDFFTKPFAIEFLILDHVNQPVGMDAIWTDGSSPQLIFEIYNNKIQLKAKQEEDWISTSQTAEYWKKYWTHIIICFDGTKSTVFVQGEKTMELDVDILKKPSSFYLRSFLTNEPHMQLHDLLKQSAIYEGIMDAGMIIERFDKIQNQIESGKLFPEKFHLMAGPYLGHVQEDTVQIVWETDKPSKSTISYGEKLPLVEMKSVPSIESTINSIELTGLNPGTTYYYQVEFESGKGEKIITPVLTFQTVKPKSEPFLFGIISDTESRPHINHRVGEMLWDERPDFLIHLGDLSDGGKKDHKFEWTMEYFQGIGPLTSRVPIATVPGNGDADLFWYSQYHPHSGEKGYYRFDYGEASFWMLNSNLKMELQSGGEQYNWLMDELNKSSAKWKFVVLHHAPYTSDEDDYGDTWAGPGNQGDDQLKDLVQLVESNEVDMVFYGHLHTYMRSHTIKAGKVDVENGVTYIQAGGTGGNLEDNAPTRTWFAAKNFRGFHYCTVQVVGEKLELRTYDLNGSLIDFYSKFSKK
ncbi:metallophosphoesterase [Aquiflexum sp.]|uniref:metallophosphoesterase n=1 Tax=Aquiflexum sp. TaxID=1872584 RepID=UPI0035938885